MRTIGCGGDYKALHTAEHPLPLQPGLFPEWSTYSTTEGNHDFRRRQQEAANEPYHDKVR
jgi:hypothetical protein